MTTKGKKDEAPALPVGESVGPVRRAEPPGPEALAGRFVALRPLRPAEDAEALYAASHGDAETERLWTYMPYGPFADAAAMQAWLEDCARSGDPLFRAVLAGEEQRPVGMVSFLNIVPAMGRLELGHIWYGPAVQRSKVNTEAVYLMLRETFDALGYRRAEWKCDALNARSRAAALRLGFAFEGIFRQHLIVKGRNRDTAWYALLDHEWPAVKANMEAWLYGTKEPQPSLRTLNEAARKATEGD